MSENVKRILTGLLIIILFFIFIFSPNWFFSLFLGFILLLILIFEWPKFINFNSFFELIFTLFYPILPFVLMIFMQQNNFEILNLFIIVITFAFDASSFIFGKLFGKHKLSPKISPSKTWQGFFGGCFLTLLIAKIFFFKLNFLAYVTIVSPLIILICFIALAGDLFESYLKRRVGLKDSGQLLPGHGGLLDRFDGVLFVAVFVFFLRNHIIKLIN